MKKGFTKEEQRKYMFKKHVIDHLFEYIIQIIITVACTMLLLYICKAERLFFGIICGFAFSIGSIIYNLYHYKKEYIDVDIK